MNKKRDNYIGIYIIIISILVLSFLILEAVNELMHLDNMKVFVSTPTNIQEEFYDLSNIKFKRVYLTGKYTLKNRCSNGCNLSVSRNKRTVYYMIEKKQDGYYYKMAIDSKLLVNNKFLGESIDKAYINSYIDNIVLFNTIDDGVFAYDYINIINKNYIYEEIKSIGENSLELTDSGILYNMAVCRTNIESSDQLVKVRRVAFTNNEEEISREDVNFSWCT